MKERDTIRTLKRLVCAFAFLAGFAGSMSGPVSAHEVNLTIDELVGFMQDASSAENPVKRSLAKKVQQLLVDSGLSFNDSQFSFTDTFPGKQSNDFYKINDGTYVVALDNQATVMSVRAEPGNLGLDINLTGTVTATTNGRVRAVELLFLAWDGFDLYGQGRFNISLHLNLDASVVRSADGFHYVFGGEVIRSASGPLSGKADVSLNVNVDTDFSIVTGEIVQLFVDKLTSRYVSTINERLQGVIKNKNADLRNKLVNGQFLLPIDYKVPSLPEIRSHLGAEADRKFGEALNLPVFGSLLEDRYAEVVFYAITDDRKKLEGLLCDSTQGLQAGARLPTLYSDVLGTCAVADLTARNQAPARFFSDSLCSAQVPYEPVPYQDFCSEVLRKSPNTVLGNAGVWAADTQQPNNPLPGFVPSRPWTLAYGSNIALSVDPVAGKTIPYMKRFRYRELKSGPTKADCQLEMRVYKKSIEATNLKPLLAFHGGSWNVRNGTYLGLESQIAHFTENGFIVFAPFYRLSGTVDGTTACNGASWDQVVSDAEAALAWVKTYGYELGAIPNKVGVWGQSAGAHLAGWVLSYHPQDVAGGILLYPPTDVTHLLTQYRSGYFQEAGVPGSDIEHTLNILSNFAGADARTLPLTDKFVERNSFASIVGNMGGSVPPVFILHGMADTLVPTSQSVVWCNAVGGNAPEAISEPRSIFTCGLSGTQLHLFRNAGHMLDTLLASEDGTTRRLVADSMRQSRAWLASAYPPPGPLTATVSPNKISVSRRGSGPVTHTAIVSPSGGSPPYTFRWSSVPTTFTGTYNPVSVSGERFATFTGVASVRGDQCEIIKQVPARGNFRVTVSDSVGATATQDVSVAFFGSPSIVARKICP